jgi:hypothetical protein
VSRLLRPAHTLRSGDSARTASLVQRWLAAPESAHLGGSLIRDSPVVLYLRDDGGTAARRRGVRIDFETILEAARFSNGRLQSPSSVNGAVTSDGEGLAIAS